MCCKTLADAQRSLLPSKPADVSIDQASQAFDFGGNKAYFVLYELPPYTQPYSIVISSREAGTQQDIARLIPRVALYDQQFQITRYFDESTLRSRGNTLERTVFINPGNAGERYVAIYGSDLSAPVQRAYSEVAVSTVPVGLGFFNYYSGKDAKATLRSSPTGTLKLEVQGLEPAAH